MGTQTLHRDDSATSVRAPESNRSKGPVLVIAMEPISYVAKARSWEDLEEYYNPGSAFSEVHVVSITDNHEYSRTRFGSLVIHPIPSRLPARFLKIPNNLFAMLEANRCIRRVISEHNAAVVVQGHGGPLKYGLPAVTAARSKGVPSIIALRSDYPEAMAFTYSPPMRFVARMLWKYLFSSTTGIRSVSPYIAYFADDHGAGSKVEVIPNKEDLARFQAVPDPDEIADVRKHLGLTDIESDDVVFLTVGRLIRSKNIDAMMTAFARAAEGREDLHYLIVGDGPERGPLESLARQLGIGSKVRFLGFLDHERLRILYRLSDVLLFVTHYEGQPRVVLEAILSGLPVVCSDRGEVCNLVAEGVGGMWTDTESVVQIQAAIERLSDDSDLRAKLGTHEGFRPEEYSLDRVGQREVEYYLEVAEKGILKG